MKLLRAVICIGVSCALLASPDGRIYANAVTTLVAIGTRLSNEGKARSRSERYVSGPGVRVKATGGALLAGRARPMAEAKAALAAAGAEPNDASAQGATIIVDGRTLAGPFSFPQQRGGRMFLPVVAVARALGDTITVRASARTVEVLRRTGIAADFNAELNQVRENGSVILALSNTADIIFPPNPDELMLPVEIVAALLEVSVRLDEGTRAIQITRGPVHAETVRAGAVRTTFELYDAEYDYNFNMYPSAFVHNLTFRSTGRIGDGRFSLVTNSGSGTGTGFGPLRNATFTYERPGGQRFTGGDFSTGTDLLFMSTAMRGVLAQIPIGGMRLTAFGGRALSGAFQQQQPLLPDGASTPQQQAYTPNRNLYDTTVAGAYVTFGPSVRDPFRPNQLLFSSGAMYFNSPGRSGQLVTGSVRYSSRRTWLQGDVGFGQFARTDQGARRSGTGLAVDLSGSFNVTDNLTVQGRYAHTSPNFQGLQSGSYAPVNLIAGGVTWRAKPWLTATLNASTSTRPDTPGQRDRFIAATVSLTPRPGLPSVFLSHTQSSTTQSGSGAFTLLSMTKEFSRWHLFVNATRSKTVGPAFVNAQLSASRRLGESSTIQLSQSFGSRGALAGTVDWQTPALFTRRLSFGAGLGYLRNDSSPVTTIQKLSASVSLPRQNTLQFAYLHSQTGPQLLVSLRGPLFRGGRRAEAARSASASELNSYGSFYGRVYQDSNLNGRYDPDFDRPQANVQVRVDGNRYVTTDENGLFRIETVHVGDHVVYLDLLSVRADLTLLDGPQQAVTLLPGRDSIVDFRLVRTGRLSGIVWFDVNGDGQLDEDERPLSEVRIVTGSGRDTLTDENGVFTIGDLPPGEHVLLIDEKTLPENTKSAAGALTIKVQAGSETADVKLPVVVIPAEIKRFPIAAN
ncbi:MAG TPA: hypothetical protein VGX92_00450 [Pyrinomonadaceae bacterium]|jgi:hypothetical protein|nr:hypothetical protein [Pyrinomonadaceae bacterium]